MKLYIPSQFICTVWFCFFVLLLKNDFFSNSEKFLQINYFCIRLSINFTDSKAKMFVLQACVNLSRLATRHDSGGRGGGRSSDVDDAECLDHLSYLEPDLP